jgi:hypothetical protein
MLPAISPVVALSPLLMFVLKRLFAHVYGPQPHSTMPGVFLLWCLKRLFYRIGAGATSHRPEPTIVVVTPSFVIELA